MIARALIGHGPTGAVRRAAYASVLGEDRVDWLSADANLADDVVVDLDDPDALPAALRDQLLASDALVVTGAPLPGPQRPRVIAAWPDLLSGPVAAMAADLDALGPRTMSKSIVVTEAPGLGPPTWQAVLALTALGGGLRRIAARRQPRGAGFEAIYGVGRFRDDSIAYVEAVAGTPQGSGLRIYEALGRGGFANSTRAARSTGSSVAARLPCYPPRAPIPTLALPPASAAPPVPGRRLNWSPG